MKIGTLRATYAISSIKLEQDCISTIEYITQKKLEKPLICFVGKGTVVTYRYKTLKQLRNHLKEHGIEMKMTEKHFKHYRGRFIHVTIYCKYIHVTKHNYITKHCANMYWSLSLTLSLPLPLFAK